MDDKTREINDKYYEMVNGKEEETQEVFPVQHLKYKNYNEVGEYILSIYDKAGPTNRLSAEDKALVVDAIVESTGKTREEVEQKYFAMVQVFTGKEIVERSIGDLLIGYCALGAVALFVIMAAVMAVRNKIKGKRKKD